MSVIDRIRAALGLLSEKEKETLPCNVAGHDWDDGRVSGYFTQGVPHHGIGDSWRIEKQIHRECTKCGSSRFDKTRIGKVRVSKKTDEITVVSNRTQGTDADNGADSP